jgi:hypothetical protein
MCANTPSTPSSDVPDIRPMKYAVIGRGGESALVWGRAAVTLQVKDASDQEAVKVLRHTQQGLRSP